MTPEGQHQRVLELRVLRGAALAYQAQTDVSAGREPALVDGKQPGIYLREQVRELALEAGSIVHLLAELDQAMHELRRDEASGVCTAETWSWRHFTSEQVDAYWIRCTLGGPHEQHEDENTGLTWTDTTT